MTTPAVTPSPPKDASEGPLVGVEDQLVEGADRVSAADTAVAPAGAPGAATSKETQDGTIAAVVRWRETSEPASGVMVSLRHGARRGSLYDQRHGMTDDEGRVAFASVAPGEHKIALAAGLSEETHSVQVEPAATTEVELTLLQGISVTGVVLDAAGGRVPMADLVWLNLFAEAEVIARSDASGAFAIQGILIDGSLFAQHAKEAPSAKWRCEVSNGSQHDLVFQLRGPGASIEGLVVNESGAPVPGAKVSLGTSKKYTDGPHGSEDAYMNKPAVRRTLTDEEGRFEFISVTPVEWTLLVNGREYAPLEQQVSLSPGTREVLRITLSAGAVVHGIVTDSNGLPVEGVKVMTWRHTQGGLRHSRSVHTDPMGAYELVGLPRLPETPFLAARVGTPDAADTVLDLALSERVEWSPVVAPPSGLTGVVIGPAGEPLEGLIVTACGPGGIWDSALTHADGTFSLSEDLHDARDLSVKRAPSAARPDHPGFTLHLEKDVLPAVSPIVIQVTEEDLAAGSIEGQIIDPTGKIPGGATVAVELSGWPVAVETYFKADGSFTIDEIPAGRYEVRFTAPDRADWTGSAVVEADKVSRLGEIHTGEGGLFRWDPASLKNAGWPKGLAIIAINGAGGKSKEFRLTDTGDQGPLPAGDYTFQFVAQGYAFADVSVEIRGGETAPVLIPVATVQEGRVFQVVGAEGAHLEGRIATPAGARVLSVRAWLIKDPHELTLPGLPDGEYVLHLRTFDQRAASHAFEVRAAAPSPEMPALTLR